MTGMLLPDPTNEPTISVERAGQLLGISRGSAYEAVRHGEVPSIRIGHRVVVPTAALLRLLGIDPGPATAQRDNRASSGTRRRHPEDVT
jgi:excisionase family DNA binding protein